MGMTLGLNTALSGLLTNQKGLDVISQNIVNVNTKGYVRKVMAPESVTLAGAGAGVQQGALIRSVDEGLMKDIRAQTTTQGSLDAAQQYFPRIENLFGQVGDDSSISHNLQTLQSGFETLSTSANTASLQWQVVSDAQTVTSQFQQMTSQLQNLRLEADRGVQDAVSQVNQQLSTIFDLNQKIVRGSTIGTDVADLMDKRDTALTKLSSYMDIQYFNRGDGSIGVYTPSGRTLVDRQAAVLSHSATTISQPWMAASSGNFSGITIDGAPGVDLSNEIKGGQLRGLLDVRDKSIPDFQAQIDELAQKFKQTINQVNNSGTSYPTPRSQYTGTRQLMDPTNSQATMNSATPQKMWLSGTDDTTIALFDSNGDQVASTTLRTIMASTQYNDASGNPTSLDISSTPSPPGVAITDVAAKLQNWLKQQTYQGNALTGATASVASGTFKIDTGNSSVSLAFRDQTASANGSTTTNAQINFDANGDGLADLQSQGFSNFFGLNDFFTQGNQNAITDSEIQPTDWTSSQPRKIELYDSSGKIGNTVYVPAGSSLQTVADLINAQTQTTQSADLKTSALTLTSSAQISISDSNGTINGFPLVIPATAAPPGSLKDIADAINGVVGSPVTAEVVQNSPGDVQLRIWDKRGMPLTFDVSGGATSSGASLKDYLALQSSSLVNASVVPEGSGARLRIRQTGGKEMYVADTTSSTGSSGSLIGDLGLHSSASATAGALDVRTDLKGSPSLMSRGTMQYNADIGKYYLSEGDNSTTLAFAAAMSSKTKMATSGQIYAGSYTFSEHGAATIGVVSTDASDSADRQSYQTTLGQALDKQYTSYSGVNLDEEVANMVSFQQAYSASAKVISTLQEMLDVLVNIIR
jgi:flagellar hook-associated protein 1 FlgK